MLGQLIRMRTLKLGCLFYLFYLIAGVIGAGTDSRCDYNFTYFAQSGRGARLHVTSNTKFVSLVLYEGVKEKLLLRSYTETELIIPDDTRLVVDILDERNVDIVIPDVQMSDAGIYTVTLDEKITQCWELFVLDIVTPRGTDIFNEYEPVYFSVYQEHMNPNINISTTWLYDGLNVTQTSEFLEVNGQLLMICMTRKMNGKLITYRIEDDTGHVYNISRTINVAYDKSFIIAVSILGSVQFITILVFGVCIVLLYKKSRQENNYLTCIYEKSTKRPGEDEHKYDNRPAQDKSNNKTDDIQVSAQHENNGYLEPDDFTIPS